MSKVFAEHHTVREETPLSFLKELPLLIISAVIIAWIVKSFIFQPFYIPSESMLPTLVPQDRVLVNKFIYRLREMEPGEIVVFIPPNDKEKDYIKRIIAVEGQTVEVRHGKVYVDGKSTKEDYVSKYADISNYGPTTIKKGYVFVMGDNRPNSYDSRMFGFLSKKAVVGRALCIYWPFNRVRILK